MPALDFSVAESLVIARLEGLPGDPKLPGAYRRLQHIVVDLALSVDHARAALECFDEKFPSPHELKDVLWNLRPKYSQPEPAPQETTPDQQWSNEFVKRLTAPNANQIRECHIQAIKDMLYYTEGAGQAAVGIDRTYWANARFHDLKNYPGLVAAIRDGREPTEDEVYPLSARKKRGVPSPTTAPPIVETDLELARQRYEAEKARLRAEAPDWEDDGYREPGEDQEASA